jgi:hypothetical protein
MLAALFARRRSYDRHTVFVARSSDPSWSFDRPDERSHAGFDRARREGLPNQYWSAQNIVDRSAKIVFEHSGEGRYDEIERTIREPLNKRERRIWSM